MTESEAQNAVLLGAAVTLASTTAYTERKEGKVHVKTLGAGVLAFTVCGVIAEVDPNLGGYLAIAIGMTAAIKYGLPVVNEYFGNSTTEKKVATHGHR